MRILSLSDYIPDQICDVVRFTQYVGDRNIPHYCGYASDFLSQALQDGSVDGAVFPRSCDSSRILGSYLAGSGKFVHQMHIPSSGVPNGAEYFAQEIRRYKAAVEAHYGVTIGEETVDGRIALVNARNRELRRLYDDLESLSYAAYLEAVHALLQLPLERQSVPSDLPGRKPGKRVFVIGSFLSNPELPRLAEAAGLQIVGDSLPESGRLTARPDAVPGADRYLSIAGSILSANLSPTQNGFRATLGRDLAQIRRRGAAGVLFLLQQYCEPYDYYYAAAKTALEDAGLPTASLSVSDTTDAGSARLTLEAFADVL